MYHGGEHRMCGDAVRGCGKKARELQHEPLENTICKSDNTVLHGGSRYKEVQVHRCGTVPEVSVA